TSPRPSAMPPAVRYPRSPSRPRNLDLDGFGKRIAHRRHRRLGLVLSRRPQERLGGHLGGAVLDEPAIERAARNLDVAAPIPTFPPSLSGRDLPLQLAGLLRRLRAGFVTDHVRALPHPLAKRATGGGPCQFLQRAVESLQTYDLDVEVSH